LTEQVVTAKKDVSEIPAPMLSTQGASNEPADPMGSIPPGLAGFADGLNKFAERLAGFMARKDLMVR
jgi:hypothetical protein